MQKWFRFALLSLFLVAFLGFIMRYKLAFSFPFLDQKHTMHAHSHLAFTGWVSHALFTIITALCVSLQSRRIIWILSLNVIAAIGMMISFLIQGYGPVSIGFSTLSIAVGVSFALHIRKSKVELNPTHYLLLVWANVFNVLSSIGPFALAFLMINHISNQGAYMASLYFFLHFQYNGWFILGVLFLFLLFLPTLFDENPPLNVGIKLIIASVIPGYALSVLWLNHDLILYPIAIVAAVLQLFGWYHILEVVYRNRKLIRSTFSKTAITIIQLAGLALIIKVVLQTLSVIPGMSDLVFGFRPIVIGYLHLVLLGIITLSLLAFGIQLRWIKENKSARISLSIFIAGILLNEIFLMIQGLGGIFYYSFSALPYLLLFAALSLCIGAGGVAYSSLYKQES